MKQVAVVMVTVVLLLTYCGPKQDAAYFTQLAIDKLLYEVEDPETEESFATEAVNYLEKAISLDSSYALAYAYLPLAYRQQYYSEGVSLDSIAEKSRWALAQAKELAPDHSMTLVTEGFVAKHYDNDLPKAIELFKKAVDKDADNLFAQTELGWAFHDDWQYDLAIERANIALGIDPKFRSAGFMIGLSQKMLGNYDKAIEAFQSLLGENNNTSSIRTYLTHSLMQARKFDQAEEVARQNLADYPDNSQAKSYLAYALGMNKKYDEALALYTESNANIAIAWINGLMGNKEQAYEGIIELQGRENADNGWVSSYIGGIYTGLGQYDKAIEACQKAVNDMKETGDERELVSIGRWLATEPWFQPIMDDPRYQEIIAQTGYGQ